jgi:hypothetical protein
MVRDGIRWLLRCESVEVGVYSFAAGKTYALSGRAWFVNALSFPIQAKPITLPKLWNSLYMYLTKF